MKKLQTKIKVSIVIPTKNSEKFLEKCLQSIKNQTYKNYEIVIVDNYSTDKTLKIAKKFTKKVYTKGPERSAQRNFGAKKSEGNFLFFVDSDMLLTKNVLAECVQQIKNNPNIKGLVIPEQSFGEGFWAKAKKLERSFYIGVSFMEASRFFEKKAFLKVGGFDESLISGEDWLMSQKVSKSGQTGRIKSLIMHNEGHLSLSKTVSKKYYYAKHFSSYVNLAQNEHLKGQISVYRRYKLFFSNPKKLFKDPVLGLGMLFMKTSEFSAGGVGYLLSKWTN